MLNISSNTIRNKVNELSYRSFNKVNGQSFGRTFKRLLWLMLIFLIIFSFLPWTQNIRARGLVTTLMPDQRPQTIHSVIAGRVDQWFVKEGDFVKKGDTIVYISEVKDDYFDPNLLERTQEQLNAKKLASSSYKDKSNALENQIQALDRVRVLKSQQAKNSLRQAQLRVVSDSMDWEATKIAYQVSKDRLLRMESLYKEGLKSLTDLESRKLKVQESKNKMISAENSLLESRNKVINAQVELLSISNQYQDEIAKSKSERYSALSNKFSADADVSKMQNQYQNYSIRNGLYFVTAPQDGYITKAIQQGLGQTIKEGDPLVSIMPASHQLAVEMYVKPIDLPLLEKGKHVRIQFDGWPAVVFSGWPNTSYGTYGGEVFAIDNFASDNGLYRVLVAQDQDDHEWPDKLRVGAGTNNMVLLKDVPIWYEFWRQINGFPPDYYSNTAKK